MKLAAADQAAAPAAVDLAAVEKAVGFVELMLLQIVERMPEKPLVQMLLDAGFDLLELC